MTEILFHDKDATHSSLSLSSFSFSFSCSLCSQNGLCSALWFSIESLLSMLSRISPSTLCFSPSRERERNQNDETDINRRSRSNTNINSIPTVNRNGNRKDVCHSLVRPLRKIRHLIPPLRRHRRLRQRRRLSPRRINIDLSSSFNRRERQKDTLDDDDDDDNNNSSTTTTTEQREESEAEGEEHLQGV